jgi:phage FluMu gp28-like protein
MTKRISRAVKAVVTAVAMAALILFRKYQEPVFADHVTKTQVLHWSRQIGKSYTLAAWAVDRLLRYPGRLVTVLSNSKDNGAEFALKCAEVCRQLGIAAEEEDLSSDKLYENMRFEIRVKVKGREGRIKVLAANPRTARGFSGDLILDEFAFHEDSRAIWEAAEPILSSNPSFLLRIASTGNGKQNMFYELTTGGTIPVSRVTRTQAHALGVKIYSLRTGEEITPEQARAEAGDKRAYDQNYECAWADENMALLTIELISAAERADVKIEHQTWSPATIQRLRELNGDLYLGQDVGRHRDLSVQVVTEKIGTTRRVVAMLILESMRLPAQQRELDKILELPRFRQACIDMTGLGLGLVEYAQEGTHGFRVRGVDFNTKVPTTLRLQTEGRKDPTAWVTEVMATNLLEVFEERHIEIPLDPVLRDSLRKPERTVSPGGKRVSIAATSDAAGHADEFWALALAIYAEGEAKAFTAQAISSSARGSRRSFIDRERLTGRSYSAVIG